MKAEFYKIGRFSNEALKTLITFQRQSIWMDISKYKSVIYKCVHIILNFENGFLVISWFILRAFVEQELDELVLKQYFENRSNASGFCTEWFVLIKLMIVSIFASYLCCSFICSWS